MAILAATVLNSASVTAANPSWKLQPTMNPIGSSGTKLDGVSCIGTTNCTAVGMYNKTATTRVTLAEHWNGTGWKIQTTPNPTGATDTELAAVSCPVAGVCTAVGSSVGGSGSLAIAEQWKTATGWSAQTLANPTGATSSRMFGISCTSTTACTAVGDYVDSTGTDVTLAERWDGTSWVVQTTPNPSGAKSSILYGVSCSPTGPCMAVGSTFDGTTYFPLTESSSGSTWTNQFTPCHPFVSVCALLAVSCPAANACSAVGDYMYTNAEWPLEEDWNGSTWTSETPPQPNTTRSDLFGISCSAAYVCTWVGWYKNAAGTLVPFAGHRDARFNQYVDPAPHPANATRNGLFAVSCTNAIACTAAGYDFNSASTYATLAERYS